MKLHSPRARTPGAGRRWVALAALGIAAATIVAYSNSFSGVFVFDDEPGILQNPSIHHLWTSLFPPADTTVSGRPIANLSFAFNYALSGTGVWSYHAVNLLIHVLAGLVLFGICRRTFLRLNRAEADATPLAFAVALVWALHPLQTEAVTYVVQRVESLMALFYLLTFYCFIRSLDSTPGQRWRWQWLAIAACLLGTGTKEVIATAPLLVLLYDRTFVAGSLRRAWAERRGFYLALAATWLPLAALVASTGWNRGGTAGFDVGVSPWAYWLTQFPAVARYLQLCVWPHPLTFDYGTFWIRHAGDVLPGAAVVLALVAATVWTLWRRPAVGFLGAWFLVILAPTSAVPGTIQMIVEHRMYLPVAAVAAAVVVGAHRWFGRRSLILLLAVAAGLGGIAAKRNLAYRSNRVLWSDTLAKCPDSDRAHNNLGTALVKDGEIGEAIRHFQEAVRLNPKYAEAHFNLGNAWRDSGKPDEAIVEYNRALQVAPSMPDAQTALGLALQTVGRPDEATTHFEQALRLNPNYAVAHEQLGLTFAQAGRWPEAITHFEQALRVNPADSEVHNNLGNALRASGRIPEAMAQYGEALRLRPDSIEARHNLAIALSLSDRLPEAIAQYEQTLSTDPTRADIRNEYGLALLMANRTPDAIAQFERALQTNPNLGAAHLNLAMALESLGRMSEASAHYEVARRLGAAPPPRAELNAPGR